MTFFTLDQDFFRRTLCHPAYCLAYLDVRADETATYLSRFLHHPLLNTKAKRMGIVARVHAGGIQYWRKGNPQLMKVEWS